MTEGPLSARVQREQEAFNEGLQRDGYMRVFEHTSYLFLQSEEIKLFVMNWSMPKEKMY